MAIQVSPGINVSEIDLTTATPAISTSIGALAGIFQWGPANTIFQISSETQLKAVFGKPDNNTAPYFFTAANFLSYSNNIQVARASLSGALNASANSHGVLNENDTYYYNNYYGQTSTVNSWLARYPGAIGNSLKVIVWDAGNWAADKANNNSPTQVYATLFPYAPATSPYVYRVTGYGGINDEVHVAVVDVNGRFTGVANTVLETYTSLSVISDAKKPDGSSNYYKEVIYRTSNYIHWLGHPNGNTATVFGVPGGWGANVANISSNTSVGLNALANNVSLSAGADGTATIGSIENAIGLFSNPEQVDISLLMTADAGVGAGLAANTIQNYAINLAANRKDCIVLVSPPLANTQDIQNGQSTSIAGYATNVLNTYSSYGVMDSGFKYQYDKYNDIYRWIPLNGDIAGLCARTDNVRDPWWSPAGLQRGVINNAIKLAFNPGQTDRDTLYKAGINPVVSFPGQGTLLYGDKTLQNRPSAFDRINVRRLFIVLEKTISLAAKSSLFEFNDSFTRAQFVNLVDPFLRTVTSRRGIYAYKVVCDNTNNTPAVINANQFVGDIYIQPARSVNFIQLNFVAVQTGVSFSEVVGQF
jgi:Phage tail sheath protein subtilisin-like domain/Phage tail sheath C-terminal domain